MKRKCVEWGGDLHPGRPADALAGGLSTDDERGGRWDPVLTAAEVLRPFPRPPEARPAAAAGAQSAFVETRK